MTLQSNLKKLEGAHPRIRDIAIEFVEEAFALDMTFTITECLRTYERQCLLFSQGRTRNDIMKNVFPYSFTLNASQMREMMRIYDEGRNLQGNKVTWTLNSEHITGEAIDIVPVRTTLSELSSFAVKWNIRNGIQGDLGHFSLRYARPREPKMNINHLERLKRKEMRLEKVKRENPLGSELVRTLSNMIDRLKNRFGL